MDANEDAGVVIDYRCDHCLDCPRCKESSQTRSQSIREKAEQVEIERAIKIDLNNNTTSCVLPFIRNPVEYLSERWKASNNYNMALRTLQAQMKKPEADRKSVIKFHSEILDQGFAIKLKDLPMDIQESINNAPSTALFHMEKCL